MRRIIFHNSVSEQPVYKFVLQQKIAEVCKAIGFDDSDITWIIFDNRNFNLIKHTANYGWNLGELFTVNHGEIMDTVTPQEMKSGFLHLPYNRLLLRRGKSISAQLRPYAKGTY